jgi:small-conductance mechanosensitive channel
MPDLSSMLSKLADFTPFLGVVAGAVLLLTLIDFFLRRRGEKMDREMFFRQIIMFLITGLAILAVIIALPVDPETRGDLLGILGLVLTGIIAISSTTFVTNAMAGLMLRAIRSYRPGDFIRTGDQFGRVTERGLFHTEIQTEDRDLATIPNLYLVTHPVTVVHATGTIVSCELSLGYDVSHTTLEPLLTKAAAEAGLESPFVQITDLGDYAVTYRVAGGLTEVKRLLTARSQLRQHILDTLHGAGIEIMSPAFMVQRPQPDAPPAIPPVTPTRTQPESDEAPEERIFDKAEEAAGLEELRTERDTLATEIEELKKTLAAASKDHRDDIKASIAQREKRIRTITRTLTKDDPPTA